MWRLPIAKPAPDSFLNAVISSMPNSDLMALYITSPPETLVADTSREEQPLELSEMDEQFSSAMHMELRRDFEAHTKNINSSLPLFEKYEFLSPGKLP
jgi:hypothetical protein